MIFSTSALGPSTPQPHKFYCYSFKEYAGMTDMKYQNYPQKYSYLQNYNTPYKQKNLSGLFCARYIYHLAFFNFVRYEGYRVTLVKFETEIPAYTIEKLH